jgi:hypothetical protein
LRAGLELVTESFCVAEIGPFGTLFIKDAFVEHITLSIEGAHALSGAIGVKVTQVSVGGAKTVGGTYLSCEAVARIKTLDEVHTDAHSRAVAKLVGETFRIFETADTRLITSAICPTELSAQTVGITQTPQWCRVA